MPDAAAPIAAAAAAFERPPSKLSPAPHVTQPPAATAKSTETAALTSAMAAGDEAAVAAFYRRYFDHLYREARRATCRDESFCLDVVQESVLRIVRAVRPIDGEPQLLAWLRLVVRTTAYDLLRSEARRRSREAATVTPDRHPPHGDDKEQLAWLRERLRSFDPKLVRMIELRFGERWSLARIGGLFGLSVGTIDGRLRRALHHLRELAREDFYE
jgi:RNA polymerase sigma factor (sigma-70 family)